MRVSMRVSIQSDIPFQNADNYLYSNVSIAVDGVRLSSTFVARIDQLCLAQYSQRRNYAIWLLGRHVGQGKVNYLCGQGKVNHLRGQGKVNHLCGQRKVNHLCGQAVKQTCWPEEGKSPVMARGRQVTCLGKANHLC